MSEEPKQPNFNEMTYPSESDGVITVTWGAVNSGYLYTPQDVHICMDEGCEDLMPSKAHDDDAGYDLRSKEDMPQRSYYDKYRQLYKDYWQDKNRQ